MASSSASIEVIGEGELTDAAIEALAALLLSLGDQDESRSEDQEVKSKSA